MKEVAKKNKFYDAISIPVKLLFITGILFVVFGALLVMLSFKDEILDSKYKMTEVTEYISNKNIKLPEGQVYVTKELEKGIYKVTYKNFANKSKSNILETSTNLTIKDSLGEGYILKESVTINDKNYTLKDNKTYNNNGILLSYENNTIEVNIPNTEATTTNEIICYIKLIGRKTNYKYQTSKETYYNLTPSLDNNYYQKKSSQSYLIEGNAYILLTNK